MKSAKRKARQRWKHNDGKGMALTMSAFYEYIRMMRFSGKAAGWQPEEEQEYMMCRTKGAGSVHYMGISTSTMPFVWVKRSNGKRRVPMERRRIFSKRIFFRAAGKIYKDVRELQISCKPGDEYGPWYKDRYGRKVFCVVKRFPCFDSHDLIYEDRYYRWFFICEEGKLTRIYTSDEDAKIYVTEDVRGVEEECWEQMKKAGYFECR